MTTTTNIETNISTRIELITPEIAKMYLMMNTRNRKVGGINYSKIRAALLQGEWKLNGEAIKVAADGTILDGQHRLMACAETGVSFHTLIVTGLAQETQDTMDTGKSRTLADVLLLNGYKNAVALSAVVSGIIKSENQVLRSAFTSGGNNGVVTNKEALSRLDREPTIQESATEGKRLSRIGLHCRTAGVLHYYFATIDSEDTEFFFSRLQTGEGLNDGDAILVLRNFLIYQKSSLTKHQQTYLAAVTIKAWNKFRDGEPVKQLKFRVGGAQPEQFPEPR